MNRMFKIVATMLALVMVLLALPTTMAAENTYVLDIGTDMEAMAADSANAGKEIVVNDYFTVILGEKTRIDDNSKTFADDYAATKRLNFQHKSKFNDAGVMLPAVKFTTSAAATVKLWWVEGGDDNRQMVIFNEAGEEVVRTAETLEKNALCISELKLEAAGTYFLGTPDGSNYLFKMEVTEAAEETPEEPVAPETTAPVAPETGDLELYTGSDAHAGWMNWLIQINTTNWGGTVAPDFMAEGGAINVYFTGTEIWSIHLALNGPAWAQIDRQIDTATQLEDGSYVATFTYEELTAVYGTDLSGLGAIQIATNCAETGSVTVTRVTYTAPATETPAEPTEPAETTAPVETTEPIETTEPTVSDGDGENADKTGDMTFVAIFAMLASAAVLVALTQKKRAF